jgi:DNA-binding CsgD family transcriptional regulator
VTPPDSFSGSTGWRPSSVETAIPTVIFLVITICIAGDFAHDIVRGESPIHLAGMAVGTILSIGGLATMLRLLSASRSRARELATTLDDTRADLLRWREQSAQLLAGLGALIDKQFMDWDLSPAEREVALLLLKGLSLKEIAAVRRAGEATVRQQAQSVYRKADLTGRAELSAFFLEDLLQPREAPAPASAPSDLAPTRPPRLRADVPGASS